MAQLRWRFVAAVASALVALPSAARDIAPEDWWSVQAGQLTSNSAFTGGQDLSQAQYGARLTGIVPQGPWDMRADLGVLKCPAGWFFDTEFSITANWRAGSAEVHPLLVVGVPWAQMGSPYYFSGFDVTLGAGLLAQVPVGPVWLEARGQAMVNFLSYLAKLNDNPYDAGGNGGASSPREAMLLYRVAGAVWVPVGRNTFRLEARRDHFHTWWMTAVGVGMAF